MDMMLHYVLSMMEKRLSSTGRWHHGIQRLIWLLRSDQDPQHRAGIAQEFVQEELDTEDLACLVYYVLDPTLATLEQELKKARLETRWEWDTLNLNAWREAVIYQLRRWCHFCVKELEKRNALDDVVLSQDERELKVRPILGPKRTKKTYFMNDFVSIPLPQTTINIDPAEMHIWMQRQVMANPEVATIRLTND